MAIHNIHDQLQRASGFPLPSSSPFGYMPLPSGNATYPKGYAMGYGTVVPADGSTGWLPLAKFMHTDATTLATAWYVNLGTVASSTFTSEQGLLDSGGFTTATTFEAAIAEIYQDMFSATGGFIHLPLSDFRLIASNDIAAKNAADGGTISVDTDPKYIRVNGATDKKTRIAWESASVIEICTDFVYPPDLDDTANLTVNLYAGMKAGSVDVPVIAVGYFEGVGDSNAGGNTAALSTTVAQKTVTITAANLGAYPNGASISLTPGTHATASNDVYLYGAWIEYKRKLRTS